MTTNATDATVGNDIRMSGWERRIPSVPSVTTVGTVRKGDKMTFDAREFLTSLFADGGIAMLEPELTTELDAGAALTTTERGYLVPDDLPDVWREWYEKRAAIREYDGGETRERAEAGALRETRAAMRAVGE